MNKRVHRPTYLNEKPTVKTHSRGGTVGFNSLGFDTDLCRNNNEPLRLNLTCECYCSYICNNTGLSSAGVRSGGKQPDSS